MVGEFGAKNFGETSVNEVQVIIKYSLVASVEKRKTSEIATTHPVLRISTQATD